MTKTMPHNRRLDRGLTLLSEAAQDLQAGIKGFVPGTTQKQIEEHPDYQYYLIGKALASITDSIKEWSKGRIKLPKAEEQMRSQLELIKKGIKARSSQIDEEIRKGWESPEAGILNGRADLGKIATAFNEVANKLDEDCELQDFFVELGYTFGALEAIRPVINWWSEKKPSRWRTDVQRTCVGLFKFALVSSDAALSTLTEGRDIEEMVLGRDSPKLRRGK